MERENTSLHREIADHEETIETLQSTIQIMQTDHSRQVLEMQQQHRREMERKEAEHKKEVSRLTRLAEKLCSWFPLAKEILRMEKLCRLVGFDERQTATLISGKPLEYGGELYSEEHRRKFTTERADFKVVKDPADKDKLVLSINRKPIGEWFKEQFEKLQQAIRRPMPHLKKGGGMKL